MTLLWKRKQLRHFLFFLLSCIFKVRKINKTKQNKKTNRRGVLDEAGCGGLAVGGPVRCHLSRNWGESCATDSWLGTFQSVPVRRWRYATAAERPSCCASSKPETPLCAASFRCFHCGGWAEWSLLSSSNWVTRSHHSLWNRALRESMNDALTVAIPPRCLQSRLRPPVKVKHFYVITKWFCPARSSLSPFGPLNSAIILRFLIFSKCNLRDEEAKSAWRRQKKRMILWKKKNKNEWITFHFSAVIDIVKAPSEKKSFSLEKFIRHKLFLEIHQN